MVRKENEWPERGEKVVGTIIKVNPFSVLVKLEEYEGKEGMVQISEIEENGLITIKP